MSDQSIRGHLTALEAASELIRFKKEIDPDETLSAVSWQAFTGATSYVVQAASSSDFLTGLVETTASGTTADVPLIKKGAKAWWRVIAVTATGRSIPSASVDMTYREASTITAAAVPVNSYLYTRAVLKTASGPVKGVVVTFAYRAASSTAWKYLGVAATDAAGAAVLYVPGPTAAGKYNLSAVFTGTTTTAPSSVVVNFTK